MWCREEKSGKIHFDVVQWDLVWWVPVHESSLDPLSCASDRGLVVWSYLGPSAAQASGPYCAGVLGIASMDTQVFGISLMGISQPRCSTISTEFRRGLEIRNTQIWDVQFITKTPKKTWVKKNVQKMFTHVFRVFMRKCSPPKLVFPAKNQPWHAVLHPGCEIPIRLMLNSCVSMLAGWNPSREHSRELWLTVH